MQNKFEKKANWLITEKNCVFSYVMELQTNYDTIVKYMYCINDDYA